MVKTIMTLCCIFTSFVTSKYLLIETVEADNLSGEEGKVHKQNDYIICDLPKVLHSDGTLRPVPSIHNMFNPDCFPDYKLIEAMKALQDENKEGGEEGKAEASEADAEETVNVECGSRITE